MLRLGKNTFYKQITEAQNTKQMKWSESKIPLSPHLWC